MPSSIQPQTFFRRGPSRPRVLLSINWPPSPNHINMATKLCRSSTLTAALRPARTALPARREALRCFTTTSRNSVALPKDAPNPRSAPRDHPRVLQVPLVNPADKYQSKAENMHKYGSWIMGCLPKYVQQFSVWKDELTIYIAPAGVIPVFSFLKCMFLWLPAVSCFRI